jgi:branched-chain amino acid transport system permease protein
VLEYIFAGIALGSIYAIAASGIVITYISSGVLNFAFGSIAFFLARFFYYLHSQHGWSTLPAFLVSIVVAGPLLGLLMYQALFRHLRLSSGLIRIVATIGVSVALPPVAQVIFGNETIDTAPGLATPPVATYHIFGAIVTLDQLIAFGCVVAVVVIGTAILQFTEVGLKIRAMVDTEAMTSLSGVNPNRLSAGVWMVTTALAGLVGVLAAPSAGLSSGGMTLIMAAAFAPVVGARLRSLPIAVGVAMAMGIVTDVIQKYLPQNSSLTNAILTSIPFMVMGLFLVAYIAFSGAVNEASSTGGALDAAIRPMGGLDSSQVAAADVGGASRTGWSPYMLGPVVVVVLVGLLPFILNGYWLTLLGTGFAYAIILLSFTMVVGEGGMIWLCQATFGLTGAVATAELSNNGVNAFAAIFIGGLIAAPIGVLIGVLTIRLGELYVALVTLTFGLLAETLIFTRDAFYQDGVGLNVDRPSFISGDKSFALFALAVFIVLSIIVSNLRRSTTGLSLAAVRFSEPGSRMIGLNTLSMKLLVAAIGSFIAAVGGGLLAMNLSSTSPSSFTTFGGLVWLAVFVTIGLRSISAALLGGIAFTLMPGVFQTYLSTSWGNVPTILFGLGAIGVAKNPEGSVTQGALAIQGLISKMRGQKAVANVKNPVPSSDDSSGTPPSADAGDLLGSSPR